MQAILVTREVFADGGPADEGRVIRVVVQLRNNRSWTTDTAFREIELVAMPDTEMQNRGQQVKTSTTNCPNRPNGLCVLTPIALDNQAFTSSSGDSGSMIVSLGFLGVGNTNQLGAVLVHPLPPLDTSHRDTLSYDVPKHGLYPAEQFTVTVSSRFRRFVDTFQVQLTVGNGLEVVSGAATDSDEWNGAFEPNEVTGLSGSGAFVRKEDRTRSAEQQLDPVVENLLAVTLRVRGNANPGSQMVNLTITRVTDSDGLQMNPASTAIVRSRGGVAPAGGGAVAIYDVSDTAGFFAHLQDSKMTEVVNLAAIKGSSQRLQIGAVAIKVQRASLATVSSGLVCAGTDNRVVEVSGCVAVLSDQQNTGAPEAIIRVFYGGHNRTVPMRILVAESGVIFSRSVLNPVADVYVDGSDCQQPWFPPEFVRLTVTVTDSVDTADMDITEVVTALNRWESSNETVAAFDGATGWLNASTPGTTTLSVPGLTATHVVSVSGAAVQVSALEVDLVKRLNVVTTGASSVPYATITATATVVREQLRFEGQTATVVTTLRLSNGVRVPVSSSMGINLTSNEPGSVQVQNQRLQTVVIPRSPQLSVGPLISVLYQPNPTCEGGLMVQQNLSMRVEPPPAEDMIVTPATFKLVPSGGPGAASGRSFREQLRVALQFPGNNRQNNLEGDERTSYRVIDNGTPGDAVRVSTGGMVTALAGNLTGIHQVEVTFEGQNVTAIVDVTIVNYNAIEVQATPFPTAAGQSRGSFTLSRINHVTPRQYQQATVSLIMFFTSSVDVVQDVERVSGSKLTVTRYIPRH